MKKIFLLVLVLVCLFSVAMVEETDLEFVSKWIMFLNSRT